MKLTNHLVYMIFFFFNFSDLRCLDINGEFDVNITEYTLLEFVFPKLKHVRFSLGNEDCIVIKYPNKTTLTTGLTYSIGIFFRAWKEILWKSLKMPLCWKSSFLIYLKWNWMICLISAQSWKICITSVTQLYVTVLISYSKNFYCKF